MFTPLSDPQRRSAARAVVLIIAVLALLASSATPVSAKNETKDDTPAPAASAWVAPNLAAAADRIGASDLWADGFTGAGIDVAVIDTGIAPVPGLDGDDKISAVVDFWYGASWYGASWYGDGWG